jgi:hypothetical protein
MKMLPTRFNGIKEKKNTTNLERHPVARRAVVSAAMMTVAAAAVVVVVATDCPHPA